MRAKSSKQRCPALCLIDISSFRAIPLYKPQILRLTSHQLSLQTFIKVNLGI